MTDLEKFIGCYKQFGVEIKTFEFDGKTRVVLIRDSDEYMHGEAATSSDKFGGYNGFFSELELDQNGKFLTQGFWE